MPDLVGGQVTWIFDVNDGSFKAKLAGARGSVGAFSKEVNASNISVGKSVASILDSSERFADRVNRTLRTVGFRLGILGAATAGFGLKAAGDLEAAEIGLGTLLGSADEAARTIERIKKEAARTPFEIKGLSQGVQLLSAVTGNGDEAVDLILDIGESLAALGKGQPELDRIVVNLQQISATGRASALDIRQFAFAGIPIYELLTEKIGLSGEALGDFISDGKVSAELLQGIFKDATDEGGRYFGAFEAQAGGFNQVLSNLKDTITITLVDSLTESGAFESITRGVESLAEVINNNKPAIQNFIKNVFEGIESFIKFVGRNFDTIVVLTKAIVGAAGLVYSLGILNKIIATVTTTLGILRVAKLATIKVYVAASVAVKGWIATMVLSTTAMGTVKGSLAALSLGVKGLLVALGPIGIAIGVATAAFFALTSAINKNTNATIKELEANSRLKEVAAETAIQLREDTRSAYDTASDAANRYGDILKSITDTEAAVQLAQEQLNQAVAEYGPNSDQARKATAELKAEEATLAQQQSERVKVLDELEKKTKDLVGVTGVLINASQEEVIAINASAEAALARAVAVGEDTTKIQRLVDVTRQLAAEKDILVKTEVGSAEYDEAKRRIGDLKNELNGIERQVDVRVNVFGGTFDVPTTRQFVPGIGQIDLPGFASGVRNFSGGLALVGEEGPELVTLPRGSDVLPANPTKSLLSGGGGNSGGGFSNQFFINVNGTNTREEQRQQAQNIIKLVNEATSTRGSSTRISEVTS